MENLNIGKHQIVVGDCLEHLRSMVSRSVDVVVTSPPYNLGIAYSTYHDQKPRDAYLEWITEVCTEIARVLKPNGSFFLNIGSTNTDPWLGYDVVAALRDIFCLQNHIMWVKSISINGDSMGHFKPISSKRFLNHLHENIYHLTLSGKVEVDRLAIGVPFKDKTNIARRKHEQDKRCAGNVWFIPYETVNSKLQKFNHPAGFPTALPERCIKLHGGNDLIVLDPFLGTGTTLVAAERLGHRGIGVEMDRQYADTALARLTAEIEAGRIFQSDESNVR